MTTIVERELLPDSVASAAGDEVAFARIVVVESDETVRAVRSDRLAPPAGGCDDPPTNITGVGWSADGADRYSWDRPTPSPVRSVYATDPPRGTPRLFIDGVDMSFPMATTR